MLVNCFGFEVMKLDRNGTVREYAFETCELSEFPLHGIIDSVEQTRN